MDERDLLAEEFEQCRPRLRAVAYRMLGSLSEAEDAVQECWFRLDRTTDNGIGDLQAWLTTVVGRVCLDMLRSRKARRDEFDGTWLPEPVVTDDNGDPENEAVIADSVGLALLVVLETLGPAERVAFVMHDIFGMEFGEIGEIVGRSATASRQLASRARRRVRDAAPAPDHPAEQRRVVDAFLAASRAGDFEALLEVLDPDVVFRMDMGPTGPKPRSPLTGAHAVADRILARGAPLAPFARPVLVNGGAGALVGKPGSPIAVVGFSVVGGRIVEIDLIGDPAKISRLDVTDR